MAKLKKSTSVFLDIKLGLRSKRYGLYSIYQKWLRDSEWSICDCECCDTPIKDSDNVYAVMHGDENKYQPRYLICPKCYLKFPL